MARGVNKVMAVHIADLYAHGFSVPEVAELVGVSRSTVRLYVSRCGAIRTRAEGVRLAAAEGRLGSGLRGKTRRFTEEHKRNIQKARLAHGETHAKGLSLKPSGYVEVTRGVNKGRGAHRVIAEESIGRPLTSDEHVHHRDEVRSNNDPLNLQVLSVHEHCSLHAKERAKTRRRNSNGTWC